MSAHHIYTKEQEKWIAENALSMTAEELKDAFNKRFNASVTFNSMIQKRQRMGINCGRACRKYAEEEEQFLRDAHGTKPTAEIHKDFIQRFGEINYYTLKAKMQRMGLVLDDSVARTFQERGRLSTRKPVGTEHKRSGYILVKVSDTKGRRGEHIDRSNWQFKHRLMWEKYHGRKVPENHQVVFLNGDKNDFSKENLMAVPIRFMSTLSRNKWLNGNESIAEAGIKYCELYFAIQDKKNRKDRQ